jgi:choline dehydrogenase-like flavoprotein
VREIVCDDTGRATGAVYYDSEGVERFQPAEVVILACNGVGTPRLLLNSVSRRFPNGLANSSGLVGKNLMFHPCAIVNGVFDEAQDPHGPHNWLWSHEFYETSAERGFVRGYMMEAVRGAGPALTALSGAEAGTVPFGPDHHQAMRRRFGHAAGFVVLCEDLPEEHNRVTLDPDLTDAHGIPAPRIEYRLSDNTLRMLDHAVARTSEVLRAAGAVEVSATAPLAGGGWHLMGTARMGDDPGRSVVNAWGRSHDVKNLFIVDGSLFVTSGAVNPTCTIQALALFIADAMKQRLANLFD